MVLKQRDGISIELILTYMSIKWLQHFYETMVGYIITIKAFRILHQLGTMLSMHLYHNGKSIISRNQIELANIIATTTPTTTIVILTLLYRRCLHLYINFTIPCIMSCSLPLSSMLLHPHPITIYHDYHMQIMICFFNRKV